MTNIFERAAAAITGTPASFPCGIISAIDSAAVTVTGLPQDVRIGDRIELRPSGKRIGAEVIQLFPGHLRAVPEGSLEGASVGDAAVLIGAPTFAPDLSWIGRIVDPDGRPSDGQPLLSGQARPVRTAPPPAYTRRTMGARTSTGYALFDTLLPIVQGQRIGLFAGSGVGKSTLMGGLARQMSADVIVIALVGERGREVREFVEHILGPEGMARSVVIAATSDRAPQIRRRCAFAATATAEYFRDQGLHVLLMVDSVTRFAEAHREIAVASGEPAALRGYPASTGPAIAALCERAGPGTEAQGDITAVYTVLVAGSDMDEPVADMLRGVLDGHIVMDRSVAERGRYPAVDVLRSVSRSLPAAATEAENGLIADCRRLLGAYAKADLMIQSGLYTTGTDPLTDRAIKLRDKLEAFLTEPAPDANAAFARLRSILASQP